MDNKIEMCLVSGLVRIFTEYGWNGEGAPKRFSDKVLRIQYGLHHGDARGYLTHIRMLLQARQKDGKWGLFNEPFVFGIANLLKHYGEFNNLFDITSDETAPEFHSRATSKNIFLEFKEGKEAVKRLRGFGKTNIRYSLYEEYGLKRLEKDLRAAGFPAATVYIAMDTYEPDDYSYNVYDEGISKMTLHYPIMPIVIISNKK